ncbi:hypothetical protein KRE40_17105 [Elizabethkingia meningoseptica]|uniref:hypothetical protein n=1 Tax=Elizabethkingia meningoseptica TaxID=238 RepID=UPI0023AF6F51|nr:hypothetical protein [Elizabethkingia meningoseptica]MDE5439687.1 hypothetical protein [Elizabethkingia meningoseptica]MDE5510356.1 hypothetical protein [Elizabethkingia meningoseptica]MDE5517505.1 hypothetical protein [Elizabethkingia meningoseptica]MDE5528120.1 hypothetical protein [Elizabethkingia meningoseptica]MDE5531596.1 hypothetical protein [Elizabethkingia meningoseptica]
MKKLQLFVLVFPILSFAQQEFPEIKIKNYSPTIYLDRNTSEGGYIQGIQTRLVDGTNNWFFGNLHAGQWIVSQGDFSNIKFTVLSNGNAGIGTSNPMAKLDVNGGINISPEMPIQLNGSDAFHGLRYMRRNNDNTLLDGPFLYGWAGGGLGIKKENSEWLALKWNAEGNVSVSNKLEAKEIKVTTTPTADFVFEKTYQLPNLEDVEKHILEKKHLPEIASAAEMQKEGVNIGDFQIKLLQKIEELTLYSIEQNKLNKEQAKQLQQQTQINKALEQRLQNLENNNLKNK